MGKISNAIDVLRGKKQTFTPGRPPGSRNRRQPKRQIVEKWRAAHPGGSMRACQRETGLGINTVRKYWEGVAPQAQEPHYLTIRELLALMEKDNIADLRVKEYRIDPTRGKMTIYFVPVQKPEEDPPKKDPQEEEGQAIFW